MALESYTIRDALVAGIRLGWSASMSASKYAGSLHGKMPTDSTKVALHKSPDHLLRHNIIALI